MKNPKGTYYFQKTESQVNQTRNENSRGRGTGFRDRGRGRYYTHDRNKERK